MNYNENRMKNARKWMYLFLAQASINTLAAALMWACVILMLIAATQNPVALVYVVYYGVLAIMNTACAKWGFEHYVEYKKDYKDYKDYMKGEWVVI